ncbi:hypothetical protein Tco_0986268 [Tanacetum coccineum]
MDKTRVMENVATLDPIPEFISPWGRFGDPGQPRLIAIKAFASSKKEKSLSPKEEVSVGEDLKQLDHKPRRLTVATESENLELHASILQHANSMTSIRLPHMMRLSSLFSLKEMELMSFMLALEQLNGINIGFGDWILRLDLNTLEAAVFGAYRY